MSSLVIIGRIHGGVADRMGSTVTLHLLIIRKSLYITVLQQVLDKKHTSYPKTVVSLQQTQHFHLTCLAGSRDST